MTISVVATLFATSTVRLIFTGFWDGFRQKILPFPALLYIGCEQLLRSGNFFQIKTSHIYAPEINFLHSSAATESGSLNYLGASPGFAFPFLSSKNQPARFRMPTDFISLNHLNRSKLSKPLNP